MSFRQATLKSGHTPQVRELPVATGQVFKRGSLLLVNASGEYEECGADPALIAAVSLYGYGETVVPQDHTGGAGIPPGYMQAIFAGDDNEFRVKVIGTIGNAEVGTDYGVAVDTDGFWKVDLADTTAVRVQCVRLLDTGVGTVTEIVVKFLAANVQII